MKTPNRCDRQWSEQPRTKWLRLLRSLSFCASLFALSWLPVQAAKPPATIFGNYVGLPGKGKPITTRANKIRISRSQTADANVTVLMSYDKGQICELEGEATWTDGQLVLATDGLDATKPCQLMLRIKGSVLTLTDSEGRCKEVYCGTRGTFNGARFRKKT